MRCCLLLGDNVVLLLDNDHSYDADQGDRVFNLHYSA